jgi:lipoprotein-releasing system ATP-binding protein
MTPIIECKGVEKIYHDGSRTLQILRGVDLQVFAGEILAITGPSGVGKSTLLHLMGTLDKPSAGEILYKGKALTAMSRREVNAMRNRDIGFVFQFYHLLPEFNALENVMMPALCKGAHPRACRARATELLERVGLRERMTHKPGQLSGGEQQRVAIARALFNKPAAILCDEPTGNLDEHTGSSILELLFGLNEGRETTLVIVTHDESRAARADRRAYIHEGRASMARPC